MRTAKIKISSILKKLNKKSKALILAIILIIISILYISITGNTYTIKIDNPHLVSNIEKVNIEIEDENIIKCIGKSLEDGILKIKIQSISKGKTYISVNNNENSSALFCIYVHNFGIITFNEYIGNSNGSIIIPISITIFLIYLLYLLIASYKKNQKENMYQYKNIVYLGMSIFTTYTIICQLFTLSNYKGIMETINGILNMFSFSIITLPIIFIVSIITIISNILLIKKEGFSVRNLLGLLLGVFLYFTTLLPEIMNRIVYSVTWIDVHNQNGIALYIYNLIEAIINITITYIECILIGTVIMGVKLAKHIPQFNKDAIIILGCQIKKDGTLTKLLKGRVDRAIEFSKMQKEKAGKDIIFVPSGGKGSDEVISEAEAMKNYLIEQGIKEENILVEDKAKNTYENILFSNNIINEKVKNAKIAFSTTNYHLLRAGSIASSQNINIEGIGARTKSYFWINAFIREFIATLFSEKKKHIATICGIVFVAIIMIAISYLSNIL